MKRFLAVIAVGLLASCAMAPLVPSDAVRDLAPTGKLRAAINTGNAVLAQKDERTGEVRGISVDLARELARRLDVPVEFVPYDSAGRVAADVKSGKWDIEFYALDPARATEVDFSPPYVVIEGGYVVRKDSPLKAIEDFDRKGIRIAVGNKSAMDLYLTRTIKDAQLVRTPTTPDAVPHFLANQLEAAAGVKAPLVRMAEKDPALRVIPGRFMAIEQAMAIPKGRDAGARYLRAFVEDVRANGFVAAGLERSGQHDATVAKQVGSDSTK